MLCCCEQFKLCVCYAVTLDDILRYEKCCAVTVEAWLCTLERYIAGAVPACLQLVSHRFHGYCILCYDECSSCCDGCCNTLFVLRCVLRTVLLCVTVSIALFSVTVDCPVCCALSCFLSVIHCVSYCFVYCVSHSVLTSVPIFAVLYSV